MQSREDVAAALGISDRYLRYVLYGLASRKNYKSFEIPKRTGGSC
jgi:hypothetical protein